MTKPAARTAEQRAVVAAFQALTLIPLVLLGLDLVDVSWSPAVVWTVLGPSILVAFAMQAPSAGRWRPIELGDLAAAAALALFAIVSVLEWNVHTDYVFHWGTKAERFALVGGLDLEFLVRPWNEHAHPDYPNGLPTTLAAFAITGGGFRWLPAALLSTVHLGLLLLATRELAARMGAGPVGRATALGVVAWGTMAFGVGFRQAGGADLPLAAAMVAGLAILAGPLDRRSDREIAWIAAFAAISKLEGMVFAALLLAVHCARRWWCGDRTIQRGLRIGVPAAWPTAVAVGVWAWTVWRHQLFLATNTGGFEPERLAIVVPTMVRSLATPEWLGLPAVLVVLPALLLDPRARWPAALLLAQGSFYLYIYLSGPLDPEYYVVSTAARLALHLVPATLVLALVAADRRSSGSTTTRESAAPARDG